MNQETQRLTISVNRPMIKALRELARAHGYISPSGRQAGLGNISAFLGALARGDLVVFRKEAIWQKGTLAGVHPSGDPTLCALGPDGELVELIPILEVEP